MNTLFIIQMILVGISVFCCIMAEITVRKIDRMVNVSRKDRKHNKRQLNRLLNKT